MPTTNFLPVVKNHLNKGGSAQKLRMVQSLHYFPCILGFANLLKDSDLIFDGNYPFKRSSFRNRTIIAGATGPIMLSIPIVGGRNIKVIYDQVEIDYSNNWQRDHFRSLCTAYGNSPFFQFYSDEIELLYDNKPKYLFEWNLLCLKWVLKKMKISKDLDVENPFIDDTKMAEWDREYTPQNYQNIEAETHLRYAQVFQDKTGFLPNLSTLDLLFNTGPDAEQLILNI